jgi:predicted dehydrogenase
VRWGFIGAGFVATKGMAPALKASGSAELVAAASTDPARARALDPRRVHPDYPALLADPDVEIVYISLSNDLHVPWVEQALAAGKHVLCEKPLTTSLTEAQRLYAVADERGLLLVEALWSRWHPRFQALVDVLRDGSVGPLLEVDAGFTFGPVEEGNYRLDPARGGGAWWDVGCYLLDPVLAALPDAEVAVGSVTRRLGPTGVDLRTDATVHAGSTLVRLTASIDDAELQWLRLTTERASISITEGQAFTPWRAPTAFTVNLADGTDPRTVAFPAVDPYVLMLDDVSRAVLTGTRPVQARDTERSLALARALELVATAQG